MTKQLRSWLIIFLIISLAQGQPSQVFAESPVHSDINEVVPVRHISKPMPSRSMPQISQTMVITAYTIDDEGMDGLGITSSGIPVKEGITIAAPPTIPFGTQLYIPALNSTYTVTDRGDDIQGNRLDLYIADKEEALIFGRQTLEVIITGK